MSEWKSWQKFAFLGYLLLLNVIVLGALAYMVISRDLLALPSAPGPVAALPAVSPAAFEQAPAPAFPQAIMAGDEANAAAKAEETATPIPPIHIPPAPPPGQPETVTSQTLSGQKAAESVATPTPVALVQAQPTVSETTAAAPTRTNTPSPTASSTGTPSPTFSPTATPTPTFTPSPTATATDTSTPRPTATSTRTPRPTIAPTHTPTAQTIATSIRTPRPTTTDTSTPLPPPTATLTRTPRPTATPTKLFTLTPTPMVTPNHTPTATIAPQPPAVAVAALIAGNTSGTTPAARSAQPDQTLASAAGLVKALPLTNASIALNWNPIAESARYRVYSDMGSDYGVYIYKAETGEPTFIDEMLRPGMAYRYRVTHLTPDWEEVLAQVHTATLGHNDGDSASMAWQPETSTIRVTPAPTALPPDAVLLGLRSENNFTDNFNVLTIAGEVRNDSNLDVGQTDISVTFYDAVGTVIGTASGQTMLDVLPPGEISPFIITLTRPSGLASYSLRAVGRPAAPQRTAQLAVVETRRYEDEAGFFHVKGVIENRGNITARRTKVAAVIYGRDNRVINVGFTYVNPPTLPPGERAAYDVIFTYYPKYVAQRVIPFEE